LKLAYQRRPSLGLNFARASLEEPEFASNFGVTEGGMPLAERYAMASRRDHPAAIAAASDGSVLINLVELLPDDVMARIRKHLGTATLFVGVPLSERDAIGVVARLDGAAAEASAQLLGHRTQRAKRAKTSSRAPVKRR
jgi:hypothetical protein